MRKARVGTLELGRRPETENPGVRSSTRPSKLGEEGCRWMLCWHNVLTMGTAPVKRNLKTCTEIFDFEEIGRNAGLEAVKWTPRTCQCLCKSVLCTRAVRYGLNLLFLAQTAEEHINSFDPVSSNNPTIDPHNVVHRRSAKARWSSLQKLLGRSFLYGALCFCVYATRSRQRREEI